MAACSCRFPKLLRAGLLRRLDPEIIRAELMVQLAAFNEMFGRAPDFVDGHQHAQLFPGVRDAFLTAVKEAAPNAWVRQGGRNQPLARRLGAPKALFLDILSAQFRRRAARANIAFNPGFAGAYDFSKAARFQRADAAISRWAAGGRPHHVSSRLRRRNPCQPRSADRPSANTNTLFSAASISAPAGCEQSYIGLISPKNPPGVFVAYINLIPGSTTCDTKRLPTSPPRFEARERTP